MKETINYCGKNDNGRYVDFFKSKQRVKMCGHEKIFRVKIREGIKTGNHTHWSWWDNEKQEFMFTKCSELEVIMFSPFVISVAVEKGMGKLIPVIIEKI